MKIHHFFAMCACLLLSVSSSVNASIIASSSFDTGPDDWTTLSTDLTWQSTGGDLDSGYIRYNNNLGSNAIVNAPTKFLGDWANLGVNEITYQANIFQVGNFIRQAPYRVRISGPDGEATWNGPVAEPNTLWKLLTVPVIESAWDVTSGTWDGILADVTDFNIVMAYYTNTSPFEITGVDNVSLHALNAVPVPAAVWLFGTALIGLVGFGKSRKAA